MKCTRLWLADRENLLFLGMIVAHLIPLWAFRYFPSQDGPAHLENAAIVREYHDPARTAFRAYYVFNQRFTPNWAGHLALAGLVSVMPPLVAEKVFLSGYVILLPVAVRYAVAAVGRDSGFLALLGFPFVYNYLLHMGFYTFSYSLAMFFFVSGYWLKHRQRFGLRETVTLAMLSLLLYFCHIVSTVTAFLEIVLMTGWLLFPDLARQMRRRRSARQSLPTVTTLLRPLYALVPTCLLAAMFLVRNQQSRLSWEDKPPLKTMLKELVSLHSLVSYEEQEVWAARAVVCLFGGIIAYLLVSRRVPLRLTFWNGFALVVAMYIVIYLAGPSAVSSGSYIHERMSLYPFLVLILWFAAQSYGPVARRSIQALAIAASGVLLGLHSAAYGRLDGYITEYLSAIPHIAPNTTLLPISFSRVNAPDGRPISLRIDVFLNEAGYIAVERHVVDLGNYEASQTPFFPTVFRPSLNPGVQLHYAPLDSASGEFRALPTGLLCYPRRTGGRIDYVLIWGVRGQDRERDVPRLIFSQLKEGYDLIYVSPQRGLMQLYRRKGLKSAS